MNSKTIVVFFSALMISVIGLCFAIAPGHRRPLAGTFIATWGDTYWTYTFDSSMRYSYKTIGHFGNYSTKGHYLTSHDTIYLAAFPKSEQLDSGFYVRNDTLIIQSDTCLLDIPLGYEHLLMKPDQKIFPHSRKREMNEIGRPIISEN